MASSKRQAAGEKGQIRALRLDIQGLVQGVGFRPFIYRLAQRYALSGSVRNTSRGVRITASGKRQQLLSFRRAIKREAPPLCRIENIQETSPGRVRRGSFKIISSATAKGEVPLISPDIASCADCLREMADAGDRRKDYPFINCTNCGPRFTIVKDTPYDRAKTTMSRFRMCPQCLSEYREPQDRRYHAQPNACHVCGPHLELLVPKGTAWRPAADRGLAISAAAALLERGQIVAVKGLGGYHLACDAGNDRAVKRLKRRKGREAKPLALMVRRAADCRAFAKLSMAARALLEQSSRPIVLLPKLPVKQGATAHGLPVAGTPLSEALSPGNNYLGVMLPYTPVHELLLAAAGRLGLNYLVMTSGNSSDHPLVHDDKIALRQLSGIADGFLVHDRPIETACDDSVVRLISGRESMIRRGRGYVPAPLLQKTTSKRQVIATGAELKNTFCLLKGSHAFLGPHIGDLKNAETLDYCRSGLELFRKLFKARPDSIACDLHPDYLSGQLARELSQELSLPLHRIQHHHAHIAACLAEHGVECAAIGVALDGTGYGTDGNSWGGEILRLDGAAVERLAHFDYLALPGGDAAALEPGRMAVSLLYHSYGEEMYDLPLPFWRWFPKKRARQLVAMIEAAINSPLSSSCGRLFDGVAAIFDLCRESTYDGQAAVAVEMAAERAGRPGRAYDFALCGEGDELLDFRPTLRAMIKEQLSGKQRSEEILSSFHATLIKAIGGQVKEYLRKYRLKKVALAGGAFQNRLLAEGLERSLCRAATVYRCRRVPVNDGGISLGQAVIARALG